MIRLDQKAQSVPASPADVVIPPGRLVETEYFCGCKSHDPHAPDRCIIHGDPIRLTRIISTGVLRFG